MPKRTREPIFPHRNTAKRIAKTIVADAKIPKRIAKTTLADAKIPKRMAETTLADGKLASMIPEAAHSADPRRLGAPLRPEPQRGGPESGVTLSALGPGGLLGMLVQVIHDVHETWGSLVGTAFFIAPLGPSGGG